MNTNFFQKSFSAHSSLLDKRMREKAHIHNIQPDAMLKKFQNIWDFIAESPKTRKHNMTAFTLTYNRTKPTDIYDTSLSDFDDETLYKYTKSCIYNYLLETGNTNINILIYPEYTKNLELHWHGVIESSKIGRSNFIKYWRTVFGFVKISKMGNYVGWEEYFTKDTTEMKEEGFKAISITKGQNVKESDIIRDDAKIVEEFKKNLAKHKIIDEDDFIDNITVKLV